MNKTDKRILIYFFLTFLISWVLWSPFYFMDHPSEFWALPGAWGPTLAALLMVGSKDGKKGLLQLLRKLTIWRVPFKYYAFAILGPLFLGICALLVFRLFHGYWLDTAPVLEGLGLSSGQWALAVALSPLLFTINTFMGGPVAEELGWRGYAQPLLQSRWNPNLSGLCIGLLWALWHLPLMLFLPKAVGNIEPLFYIILMVMMGVLFSWLYNKTRGSVLLAILFHGGMNFTNGLLGAELLANKLLLLIYMALIALTVLAVFRSNKSIEDMAKEA